jgi:F0F1-type ATP synthase assembly protein I
MTLPRRWAHGAWRGGALGGAGLGAGFGLLLDEAEHVFSPEHMVAANLLGRQAAVDSAQRSVWVRGSWL